jgi:hypothetical protein
MTGNREKDSQPQIASQEGCIEMEPPSPTIDVQKEKGNSSVTSRKRDNVLDKSELAPPLNEQVIPTVNGNNNKCWSEVSEEDIQIESFAEFSPITEM